MFSSVKNIVIILLFLVPVVKTINATTSYEFELMRNHNRIEVILSKGEFFGEGYVKGLFSNILGEINFSVDEPSSTNGKVLIDARSLYFGYHKVDGDAKKDTWLNVGEFPKIIYKLNNLENVQWYNDIIKADAQGTLSLKNLSRQISFPVIIKYTRAMRKKFDGKQGDLLFLKGEFELSRGSIGINPGNMLNVIKDSVHVKISMVGFTKNRRPLLPSKLFIR